MLVNAEYFPGYNAPEVLSRINDMFNRYSVYSQSFGHFFSIEALYIN
ncbi:unknown [Dialister sp. CAG:357]|nr:unknown [Dialister sp. CAG:357]